MLQHAFRFSEKMGIVLSNRLLAQLATKDKRFSPPMAVYTDLLHVMLLVCSQLVECHLLTLFFARLAHSQRA